MATKARQQYFADETSLQKQSREFSIADEIQQKIDSVEEGAQVNKIETVKVNGTALVPDANKAVNVEVPDVIDNLYSTSTDDALSAKQGKVLYDYIQNIASRGRFLSNWNSATGLPMTNPSESPYQYKAGDYYSVSNVASGGGTNYRPDGSSYTIGQASTTVETEEVNVSDFYLYDGTNWLLLVNTARQIAVDSSLSTTSTNPVENRVVTNAINGKQNTLTAGNHITISSDVISAVGFQEPLTAGENIIIEDICTTESDMKGPAPSGFHVPTSGEWQNVINIWTALGGGSSDGTNFGIALKLPFAGMRNFNSSIAEQGTKGYYRTPNIFGGGFNIELRISSSQIEVDNYQYQTRGNSIRAFKNSPVIPDATWTKLYGVSIESGGIFWNATDGLISLSSNGSTWVTMMDKNLGATTVYNGGDTLTEANCGYYFQWGNNYGFPFNGSVTTSNTLVDASNYGPGNYYYSSDFIRTNYAWRCYPEGANLWGQNTQGTHQECIHNVISATDTTYTAGTGINIDANNVISCTVTPGATYTAGNGIDIDANNEISVDTTVVATQTDLAGKQDTLTAGTNVQINGSTISATDTTYNAGKGISIGNATKNARQGPSPDGFHIPAASERQGLNTIISSIFSAAGIMNTGNNWRINLHMPFAGYRDSADASLRSQGYVACYWSSSPSTNDASNLYIASSNVLPNSSRTRACGCSIRCFKDSYETPTSSRTVILGTLGSAGIFWNQTDGLISVTSDGTTGYTLMDKNLGATTVYSDGNTLSESNCGKYFQRGNDYDFNWTGTLTTSSTQIDASNYGPLNHYNSSTFITSSNDWSSVHNDDLWGDTTGIYTLNNVITNTGVTSVNGQTGDITIQTGGNYSAGTGINISNQNVISADTTVVATQTDVNNKVSKGTNQINGQLFSIEDTYGNSANFGPDYVRIDFNDGVDSGSAGFQRDSLGATANNKISNLTSDSLALKDDLNLTQTTYAEDEITVVDNGYGTSETYQFSGGGNNQIARLKDVKTYTASTGISIDANNQISNTLPGPTIAATAPTGTEGALWYDTTNDVLMAHDGTAWKEAGTQMKVLSYGHSTWQDFIDAYNENAIVYCRASSNSNPATGNQTRMAFMAYVNSATPTEVEFQYYRSRSDHNTAANQLDQVFVYKLTSASGGTWTVTERNTGAKAVAGTGISLTFGSGNMTIANTGVTSVNNSTGAITIEPGITKKFTLSSTSDTTNAQAAIDRILAGKEAIIEMGVYTYYLQITSTILPSGDPVYYFISWHDLYVNGEIDVPALIIRCDSQDQVSNIDSSTTTIRSLPTTGSNGQVLTVVSGAPAWANASGGDVVISSDSDNVLTSGVGLWAGDETDLPATPDSNTLYFCY